MNSFENFKEIEELKNKSVFMLYPETLNAMKKGICSTCGKKNSEFRDLLSRKDYKITGVSGLPR